MPDEITEDVPEAAVLAVIEVMGWPDDRGAPWEPNIPATPPAPRLSG